MRIQPTTRPGGVAHLLCYQPYPVPRPGDADFRAEQFDAGHALWPQLRTGQPAVWPQLPGAQVAVGWVPDGFVFTVEDSERLLVLGASGLTSGGLAWAQLRETVHSLRAQLRRIVPGPQLAQLSADWREPAEAPAGPWLRQVPMMGLRYYQADAERLLALSAQLAAGLLDAMARES